MQEPINDPTRLISQCNGMISRVERDVHRSIDIQRTLAKRSRVLTMVTLAVSSTLCAIVFRSSDEAIKQNISIVALLLFVLCELVTGRWRGLIAEEHHRRSMAITAATNIIVHMMIVADFESTSPRYADLLRHRAAYLSGILDGTLWEART